MSSFTGLLLFLVCNNGGGKASWSKEGGLQTADKILSLEFTQTLAFFFGYTIRSLSDDAHAIKMYLI